MCPCRAVPCCNVLCCNVLCCAVRAHLQRFFSATLQNFATQSLLMAVGVGARKALAASAAINWMLKDGMNRLVRMGVATQFGDSFDSDLKVCCLGNSSRRANGLRGVLAYAPGGLLRLAAVMDRAGRQCQQA